jgi:hypothetical protein
VAVLCVVLALDGNVREGSQISLNEQVGGFLCLPPVRHDNNALGLHAIRRLDRLQSLHCVLKNCLAHSTNKTEKKKKKKKKKNAGATIQMQASQTKTQQLKKHRNTPHIYKTETTATSEGRVRCISRLVLENIFNFKAVLGP